ncbi:mitochondrial ATPase expression-domain-containing protein [Macrophomina phaseolina]|uniref:Mitochondrial ATPase expression-domain-containing protein n=1 Tax=Macrophomina phaseolina TaxID=35725 RepID=A0ABQ8FYK1_9PEZI|nr:mitochondrial ATPase expression-domain-containing protein [Macrophomina phaseolina]
MTPAATATSGIIRLNSARLVANASSPAVNAAARPGRRRLDSSAAVVARLSGAQQQQRRHAYTISAIDHPISIGGLWRPDIAPEPAVSEDDARPEVADVPRRRQLRPDRPPFEIPRPSETEKIDYEKGLRTALRTREVDNIIQCMIAGAHDAAFVCSIQPATFTEMLRLVSSSRQLRELQQALEHSWWLRSSDLPSLSASMDQLMKAVQIMVAIRRRASSVPLNLLDYKFMLRCAAAIANKAVAYDLWRDLKDDGVEPDTDCYNAFMQAVLWERRLDQHKHGWTKPLSFRVDQYYLSARRQRRLSYAPAVGGYEEQIKALFNSLLEQSHLGDETTITCLITAFAREGNLSAVKDTLRRVYNIDADALMASGSQRSPPKRFAPSSPLHPTSRLLYTVVHAFGANSQVPVALRLTDFISSSYNIPIPIQIWSELFTWTHAQSTIRSGRFKRIHRTPNKLPLAAPEQLWQTLTSAPYHVRPSMKMFHLSITNLTRFQRYDIAAQRIRDGRQLYREHLANARSAMRALTRAKQDVAAGRAPRASLSSLQGRRDACVAVVQRDCALLRRWCQMYVKRGNGYGFVHDVPLEDGTTEPRRVVMYDAFPDWAHSTVPNFVAEFREFCPRVVQYRTHTGVVELELGAPWKGELPKKVVARVTEEVQRGGAVEDAVQVVEGFWERLRERVRLGKLLVGGGKL